MLSDIRNCRVPPELGLQQLDPADTKVSHFRGIRSVDGMHDNRVAREYRSFCIMRACVRSRINRNGGTVQRAARSNTINVLHYTSVSRCHTSRSFMPSLITPMGDEALR